MKTSLIAAALLSTIATGVVAAPATYELDSSHSQVVFSYEHLGFSTTTGMFSGFDGTITFDAEDPAASSVEISIPTESLITGWDARDAHFLTDDFFGAEAAPLVSFSSTGIEVTGEDTGLITGDLTINGITKPISIDAKLVQMGTHPMEQKPWIGFSGDTTIKRTDFDMGAFAPYVSDEVDLKISIEAMKVSGD